MEILKSWAVNVAVACFVCAVVEFMAPQDGIQRSVKFIASVFVVLMFVAPLKDIDFSVPEYVEGMEEFISEHEYEIELEQQVSQSLSAQIEGEISAFLTEKAISEHEIEAVINIDSQNNISIEGIEIGLTLNDMDYSQEIETYVKNNFGFVPHIFVLGEGK